MMKKEDLYLLYNSMTLFLGYMLAKFTNQTCIHYSTKRCFNNFIGTTACKWIRHAKFLALYDSRHEHFNSEHI